MDAIKILILAIVQGIGEFLPISSSGHLLVLGTALFQDSSALDDGDLLTLNILLHAGTLLSVLIYFWRQIWDAFTKKPRILGLIVVGSIPTVIAAVLVLKFAKFLTTDLFVTGICFIVTGVLLMTLVREKKKTEQEEYFEATEASLREDESTQDAELAAFDDETTHKSLEKMTIWDAFFVGCVQGIAVLPGLSRSGSTISAAVLRKLNREAAATYSFLLSIPVIGGGALLEIVGVIKDFKEEGRELDLLGDPQLSLYLFGALISFVVGLVSLIFLMRWLKAGKLHYFAYWLFVLGPAVIIWRLIALFSGSAG